MSLLPKEHGAYGQIAFPLIAAFAIAGFSWAGLLIAAAVIAGFLAHEPLLILLGLRGPRARRELGTRAVRWLAVAGSVAAIAGIGAIVAMESSARWSLFVPFVPALLLAFAIVRGREKSWWGETAAALTFSGVAVPIAVAGGVSRSIAIWIAVPFALLFVTSTLAVRVVILRVRGGGDPEAMTATRRAALALAIISGIVLAWLWSAGVAPGTVLSAAAPGLLTAAVVAMRPPAPAHLRTVGWTLVAVSVLTTVIVVSSLRPL